MAKDAFTHIACWSMQSLHIFSPRELRRAFVLRGLFFLVFKAGLESAVQKVAFQKRCGQERLHLLKIVLFGGVTPRPAFKLVAHSVHKQSQACCIEREINGAFSSVHHSTGFQWNHSDARPQSTLEPTREGHGKGIGGVIGSRRRLQGEFTHHCFQNFVFVGMAMACERLLDLHRREFDHR